MGGNETLTIRDFLPEFGRPVQTWEEQLTMVVALRKQLGGRTRSPWAKRG